MEQVGFGASLGYYGFMGIGIVMSLIGMYIQTKLKSKFGQYSKVPMSNGMSGKEIAEKMLADSGIYDVKVLPSQGFLSDHYNPANKTVNLSPEVYSGRSVAAAAVSAHECGHAVQHATAYSMLQLRSQIVPVVKIASMAQQYILMGAFMLASSMPQIMLLAIGVFAVTTAFAMITLPVEFDASKRALVWLDNSGVARTHQENDGAKDALKWAAMTYVAAALTALVQLVFLILQYMGRRD
jgi:uncharacterized protein